MGGQQGRNMDYTQEELFDVDLSQDTITLSSGLQTTYSLSNIDLTTSSITLAQPWATTTGTAGMTWANLTEPPSGKITLQGPNADIEVNGESLMEMLHRIEERLNLLTPNQELEAEWDQLRELGNQYRALENKLTEQGKMWDALKKMPPPEIK
jgi:hypothetical protein